MVRHTLIKAFLLHAEVMLMIVLSAISTFGAFKQVGAAQMPRRKITIGTSRAAVITSHTFNFDIVTPSALGSIEFEYCENTPSVGGPCTAPLGLSVNGASLTTQTGETGFSIHASSNANRLVLSRSPGVPTPQAVSYAFSGIMNPTATQRTVFVRISTFSSNDASGSRVDEGAVVFSTARAVSVSGFVPPYLTFCVGITVASDCSTATGSNIDLGELTRATPSAATSQFAGASNDVTGYNVAVFGGTMTSGNNLIPALATNSSSAAGTSQYGLNLRQNSSPPVGSNPTGNGTASPTSNYGSPNSFRFVSGETVASSPLPTEFRRFTVSYLVNVSANQDPGVYATTMTYVATASF